MFSFCESYFRLVSLFDWGYARTQFLLLVSRNRCGFTLGGYRNEKSATDPALNLCTRTLNTYLSKKFCYFSLGNGKSDKSQTILDITSIYNLCEKFEVALTLRPNLGLGNESQFMYFLPLLCLIVVKTMDVTDRAEISSGNI